MTLANAVANVTFFHDTYVPSRPDVKLDAILVLQMYADIGVEIGPIYDRMLESTFVAMGLYSNAFPGHPVRLEEASDPKGYANSIPPNLIVDFLAREAAPSDRAQLVDALETGSIGRFDLVAGISQVGAQGAAITAVSVLNAVYESGRGNPTLPDIDLGFPGLSDAQTEFLIGVYAAAFSRAPEHDGLNYWAGDLARRLADGLSEPDAMKEVAKAMYFSGAQNGESGTHLGHAEYVDYLYQGVLGRAADAGGRAYWIDALESGSQSRSDFIAVFLTSALEAGGDGEYVAARIAVAEYVAQAQVSGPGLIWPDLAGVLEGVYNAATAWAAMARVDASADVAAGLLAAFEAEPQAGGDPVVDVPDWPAVEAGAGVTLIGVNAGDWDAAGV